MLRCIQGDGFLLSPPIMFQEHRQPLQNASSNKPACIRLLLVNYHLQGGVKTLGGVLGWVTPSRDLLEIDSGFKRYGTAIFPDTGLKVRLILRWFCIYCTGRMMIWHRPNDCFNSQNS